MNLSGKSAIVTGSASGIGREIALTLAANGASVTVADINPEGAEAVAAQIRDSDGSATAARVDVTDSAQVEAVADASVAAFGSLDILVNVAGFGFNSPIVDMREEDWDRVLGVNLKGQFLCSRAAARRMIAQGTGGRIVNIASTAANNARYAGGGLLRRQGRGGAVYKGAGPGVGGIWHNRQRRGAGLHRDPGHRGVLGRIPEQLPLAGAGRTFRAHFGHRQRRAVPGIPYVRIHQRPGNLRRRGILGGQAHRSGMSLPLSCSSTLRSIEAAGPSKHWQSSSNTSHLATSFDLKVTTKLRFRYISVKLKIIVRPMLT